MKSERPRDVRVSVRTSYAHERDSYATLAPFWSCSGAEQHSEWSKMAAAGDLFDRTYPESTLFKFRPNFDGKCFKRLGG